MIVDVNDPNDDDDDEDDSDSDYELKSTGNLQTNTHISIVF